VSLRKAQQSLTELVETLIAMHRTARISKASNWAAGTFVIASVIQYEVCQYGRAKERAAMARVVEVIDRKQAEKTGRAAEAARLRAEAAEKAKQAAAKSWYKFW
jgi:cytochrome c oxidase assembly protein subunit 20